MRYLPATANLDSFWAKLEPKIVKILISTPSLRSWSGLGLHVPAELRRLFDLCLDEQGEPLFADLLHEKLYLSRSYQNGVYDALTRLGVQSLNWSEVLKRVDADLKRHDSRMKSPSTNQNWHTRAAKLLLSLSQPGTTLRELPVIPLADGTWVSERSQQCIYFPGKDTAPIPTDLGFKLVERAAIRNATRVELFSELGVKDVPRQEVTESMRRRYKSGASLLVKDCVAHLRWLFWNTPPAKTLKPENQAFDPEIWLCGSNLERVGRGGSTSHGRFRDIHFESDKEYGTAKLCGKEAAYLHPDYSRGASPDARHNGRPWMEWLEAVVGVRYFPRLVDFNDSSKLTVEFSYIVKARPEMLVGTLNAHWSSYNTPRMPVGIAEQLSQAVVPCQGPRTRCALKDTYLPTPSLTHRAQELSVWDDLPFLSLPSEISSSSPESWEFLRAFGVRDEEDLGFYLKILGCFTQKNDVEVLASLTGKVFEVYDHIQRHCLGAKDKSIVK